MGLTTEKLAGRQGGVERVNLRHKEKNSILIFDPLNTYSQNHMRCTFNSSVKVEDREVQ